MAYATRQDIVTLHGERFLALLADRDDNDAIDEASVDAALDLASSEIDTYLSVRYPTPLWSVPGMVKTAAVEIACYRLASDGLTRTEDIRKRYEDFTSWLKAVAKGQANLGIPELDDGAGHGDNSGLSTMSFGFVRRG